MGAYTTCTCTSSQRLITRDSRHTSTTTAGGGNATNASTVNSPSSKIQLNTLVVEVFLILLNQAPKVIISRFKMQIYTLIIIES